MAAARHAITVDYIWRDVYNVAGDDSGFARYEKGDNGDYGEGKPSHTWVEGMFIAAAVSGDPWIQQAAVQRCEGAWSFFWGSTKYTGGVGAEVRWVSWPMLILVRGFQETGDLRYWTKAKELMAEIYKAEQQCGGKGFIADMAVGWVSPLMHGYVGRALAAFADESIKRGEWNSDYEGYIDRVVTFMLTPWPNGPYWPANPPTQPSGMFDYTWYLPGRAPPNAQPDLGLGETQNMHLCDPLAWLAKRNPAKWAVTLQRVFSDAVNYGPHPAGRVAFLNNKYTGTETKAMGWMQLFRTVRQCSWPAARRRRSRRR